MHNRILATRPVFQVHRIPNNTVKSYRNHTNGGVINGNEQIALWEMMKFVGKLMYATREIKKKHGQSASEIWGKQKNSMELTEGNAGNEEIFVEIAVIIYGNHEHNVELSKRNSGNDKTFVENKGFIMQK